MSDTRSEKSASISRAAIARVVFACVAFLTVTACLPWLVGYQTGPLPITVEATSFMLAWETDVVTLPGVESAVTHYDVYYREYGTLEWVFLHSTYGPRTQTMVSNDELSYGSYEFAVSEVYIDEQESDLHRSVDFDAAPAGGWYVIWRAPKR